jgi:hypothetical protein
MNLTRYNEPSAEQCGAVSGGWHSPNLEMIEVSKNKSK